jgi:hypothetical protein
MLRVNTERRFLQRFAKIYKSELAPANVSKPEAEADGEA